MNNETIIELGFHMILRIMQLSEAGCPVITLHIISYHSLFISYHSASFNNYIFQKIKAEEKCNQ